MWWWFRSNHKKIKSCISILSNKKLWKGCENTNNCCAKKAFRKCALRLLFDSSLLKSIKIVFILWLLTFLHIILTILIIALMFRCDKWFQGIFRTRCDECVEGYYKHLPTCLKGICNPNGTFLNQVSARNTARIFRRSETQINARSRYIWSLSLWCLIFWSWGIYHLHHFRK